jgi:hypothetical protein
VLCIETPEVTKRDVPLEWGCGHTFQYFDISVFRVSGIEESRDSTSGFLKSRNPKFLFRKSPDHIWLEGHI